MTSKLNNGAHRPDDARRAFDRHPGGARLRLRRPVLDPLAAAHAATTATSSRTWQTLEEFYRDGRARSIGVSNFQVAHLQPAGRETEVVPAVNQIEVHPYFTNEEVRGYGKEHGILTEAWSPIAQGGVLDDPTIRRSPSVSARPPPR